MNTADQLIDRFRLRRKLSFWRVLSFVIAALAVVILGFAATGDQFGGRFSDHIAKIRIEGAITENEELIRRLNETGKSDAVKGVILAIDSPGGTTVGGEAIFDAVRELAARKPVVAQIGTLAASAGYLIATGADHLVARQTSIVGSIGVILQFPDFTGLMGKIGISLQEIKSSPLKAEPSPFNETTDAERAMIRAMIMDSYEWFVSLVTQRRPLSRGQVEQLADGSVFTGRQGLENKLVDALGGEEAARAWLEGKGVEPDLEILEWKPAEDGITSWVTSSLFRAIAGLLGVRGMVEQMQNNIGKRIFLDGLVSVWHPE